jgi:hypothetical protein
MTRQESPRQHFDNVEHRLNKELATGQDINAASLLLSEFAKNPEEAKALVKRAMALPNSDTLSHLGIDKNGDIFVWDSSEHNGIYAGHAPDLVPKPDCAAAPTAADVPPPAAAVPPPPLEASDVPPPPPPVSERIPHPEIPAPAVCVTDHTFQGLNLGLVRLGVYDHKSFGVGVNVGIAKADGMLGGHTGVDARVGLPTLGACGAGGLDINQAGLHAGGKVRVNVANIVGGGVETGAGLGPVSYARAEADGEAFGAHASTETSVVANDQGVFANHAAEAGYLNWVGVSNKAHANISADSSAGSSVRGYVGPASIETGGGVETDNNTVVRSGAYLDFGSGTQHGTLHGEVQVGPSADVRGSIGATNHDDANPSDWQSGTVQAGVGVNGVGVRAIDAGPTAVKVSPFGVGHDYRPAQGQ